MNDVTNQFGKVKKEGFRHLNKVHVFNEKHYSCVDWTTTLSVDITGISVRKSHIIISLPLIILQEVSITIYY